MGKVVKKGNKKEETEEKVPEVEEEDEKPKENGKEEEEKPAENGDVKDGEKDDGEEKGEVEEEKDSKKKADKKKPKEKKVEEENEDNDDESSEAALGTIEKPVEILTQKRERKSTAFFTDKVEKEKTDEEAEPDYSEGKGTTLKEISYVNWKIGKEPTDDLTVLHKLMYQRAGKHTTRKMKIRQFCGYPFDQTSKRYKSVSSMADRLVIPGLKYINGILGLENSKDKDVMRNNLLEFLMEPKDLGKKIPTATTPASKKKKKPAPRRSKTPKREAKEPKKEKSGSADDVSDVSEDNDSSSGENGEEEKPAKKKTTKATKKATPVKIALPAKKKSASKKRKVDTQSESSDEDDEPLVKKKKGAPTDAELKKLVSSILKDADLEQVTMKNVVRQVYDKHCSFDLTSRKDYIKNCVKELIS